MTNARHCQMATRTPSVGSHIFALLYMLNTSCFILGQLYLWAIPKWPGGRKQVSATKLALGAELAQNAKLPKTLCALSALGG
jgi:hypothetical protein